MQFLELKQFTEAERAQLTNLSFCAGGNLRKSASKARVRLRNKESEIYTQNFKIKLKNFCIKLSAGIYEAGSIYDFSNSVNLHKNTVDEIDYSLRGYELFQHKHTVKMFIQNYLPLKYLKMYHYNMDLIEQATAQEPKEATKTILDSQI